MGESVFKEMEVTVLCNTFTMLVCERSTVLGGVGFRETRRLSGSHRTAIITTNRVIGTADAAGKMFGRWGQENFFRYLIMDYDFDKMITYGIETVDENKEVVNPVYRNLGYKIAKAKSEVRRIEAQIYELSEQAVDGAIKGMEQSINKQADLMEKHQNKQTKHEELQKERMGDKKKDTPKRDASAAAL